MIINLNGKGKYYIITVSDKISNIRILHYQNLKKIRNRSKIKKLLNCRNNTNHPEKKACRQPGADCGLKQRKRLQLKDAENARKTRSMQNYAFVTVVCDIQGKFSSLTQSQQRIEIQQNGQAWMSYIYGEDFINIGKERWRAS